MMSVSLRRLRVGETNDPLRGILGTRTSRVTATHAHAKGILFDYTLGARDMLRQFRNRGWANLLLRESAMPYAKVRYDIRLFD